MNDEPYVIINSRIMKFKKVEKIYYIALMPEEPIITSLPVAVIHEKYYTVKYKKGVKS